MVPAKPDAGLESVVAGETQICSLEDGLRYRGYSVEDLADHATFEEVAYLLLYSDLPTRDEHAAFCQRLRAAQQIPIELCDTIARWPATTHAMDAVRSGTSMLAHWDANTGSTDRATNVHKAERLLAQLPLVVAADHARRIGRAVPQSRVDLSFAGNLLWLLTGVEPTEQQTRAMDVSLTLYAEHEFNASTFTARVVASTLADYHAAITAAIGALKGPLHGGANERVLEVLQQVGSPENAVTWIRDALARKIRVMGFGHRVYKSGDPRAKYLLKWCRELATSPEQQRMEQVAEIIEQAIVREKGLPPNLDWPSARLYAYLGLPVDLYTPLFVISRVTGWSAHVLEQWENNRLIRPRSIYNGAAARDWRPMAART